MEVRQRGGSEFAGSMRTGSSDGVVDSFEGDLDVESARCDRLAFDAKPPTIGRDTIRGAQECSCDGGRRRSAVTANSMCG